ncbi:MAG TPA: MFS transporter [Usitatibacter sp.]|nr:MFS transporter [Usitatibacter sp.]
MSAPQSATGRVAEDIATAEAQRASPGPRAEIPLRLIIGVTVLTHAAFNGTRLAMSLDALSLGATPLAVGAIMSILAALPMLLAVAAGRMVDRIGVRRPMIWGIAGVAASVSLPALFPGLPTLYVAAAGAGSSFMLFHICVQHAIGEGSDAATRKANFGWLALGFSISNFLGPTIAGVVIDWAGHRVAFAVATAFALASLTLVSLRRRSLAHRTHAPEGHGGRSALELLRQASLRRVFIVTGILASAWDVFVFVVPIYGHSIGLTGSRIGMILGSFAFATFVVRLALPWLSRHLRDWAIITGTMCVAGTAYATFPLFETVPMLAAIAFVLGLGLGATQPSTMSLIYATAPAGRAAEAVGLRSVVLNASSTVLPLAFGGVASIGMLPVFWSMAGLVAGGGWFAERQRRATR